jgi:hypothetical protein
MHVTTFTPFRIPFRFAQGVAENNRDFRQWLRETLGDSANPKGCCSLEAVPTPGDKCRGEENDTETSMVGTVYEELDRDYMEARLVLCRFQGENYTGILQVFPDQVVVAEITLHSVPQEFLQLPQQEAVHSLSHWAQQTSVNVILEAYNKQLEPAFQRLKQTPRASEFMAAPQRGLITIVSKEKENETTDTWPKLGWVSRALVITNDERQKAEIQDFVTDWLKPTLRPEDADDINTGRQSIAMRWLNYVLVEDNPAERQYAREAMCLAQFFYMAQETANTELYEVLSKALDAPSSRKIANQLQDIDDCNRYRIIRFHELRKYLERRKKKLLDEILSGWEFNDLLGNTQRMLEMNRSRVQQITKKRTERNTILTDMILAGVTIVLLLELVLAALQSSREFMLNPTLAYRDQGAPWLMSFVAAVDADLLISGSLIIVIILLLIYARFKIR